jgi:putative transposon-encoded protein
MDLYEKMNAVEIAFRAIFHDAIYIETKKVRVGGTSNHVYVPKEYAGNPVTIIIWDKLEDTNGTGNEQSAAPGTKLQA